MSLMNWPLWFRDEKDEADRERRQTLNLNYFDFELFVSVVCSAPLALVL